MTIRTVGRYRDERDRAEQGVRGTRPEQVEPHLSRDTRRKRDLFRTALPAPLGRISPWIGLSADGSRLMVDKVQDGFATATKTGITFLPTVFGSPVPGSAPEFGPNAAVVARLHALDNPIRLRLARSLARGAHHSGTRRAVGAVQC